MCHRILLLAGHQQTLLVLLLQQHELHLVILKCVIPVTRVRCLRLSCSGGLLRLHRLLTSAHTTRSTTIVGVELLRLGVSALLAAGLAGLGVLVAAVAAACLADPPAFPYSECQLACSLNSSRPPCSLAALQESAIAAGGSVLGPALCLGGAVVCLPGAQGRLALPWKGGRGEWRTHLLVALREGSWARAALLHLHVAFEALSLRRRSFSRVWRARARHVDLGALTFHALALHCGVLHCGVLHALHLCKLLLCPAVRNVSGET
ncbi:hypothetical protein KC361_g217 [Hortaea werneckii]|nr:hypothetical protein KC361_g217 [Hortaea werneckii]